MLKELSPDEVQRKEYEKWATAPVTNVRFITSVGELRELLMQINAKLDANMKR